MGHKVITELGRGAGQGGVTGWPRLRKAGPGLATKSLIWSYLSLAGPLNKPNLGLFKPV